MCADRLQQDRFRSFMLNKTEYNPEVVSAATGPGGAEFAMQLVSLQARMECIGLEEI